MTARKTTFPTPADIETIAQREEAEATASRNVVATQPQDTPRVAAHVAAVQAASVAVVAAQAKGGRK